ncbi:hypothetical protein ACJRO7_000217 [Eucalyptus globulus]|uniref:HotDog ACOT-type domain-containing protein n=1 Tax=Eucalyptus globulus TaxID=34317 RepID=A0ABD3LLZ6_EUCGL
MLVGDQYRNPWMETRMGKLVEDVDALAGTICCCKHCFNDNGSARPLLLVTASVDRMVLKRPIHIDTHLQIARAVTWVRCSSMAYQLRVTQSIEDIRPSSDSVALTANFTFVARDSKTGKSAPIKPIFPETKREKLLWQEAKKRSKMRKKKREERNGDTKVEDLSRLLALLAEGHVFCNMPALADTYSILIRDTCFENSLVCQPFEMAFSTRYAFAGVASWFFEVDHVDFLRPADAGNFLCLKCCGSNEFYFTLTIHPEALNDGLKAWHVLERLDAESCQTSSWIHFSSD